MTIHDDRHYYDREMKYLRVEGAKFAKRHPNEAMHLGYGGEKSESLDPHAERIIESFAFLTGKLNRFLDAQFPELVHSLFHMLYPYYLRPLPAKVVVGLEPKLGMLDGSKTVPPDTPLKAPSIGPEGQAYTYSTCWQTMVHPLKVNRFWRDPDVQATHSLTLELTLPNGLTPDDIQWDQVEFFIDGGEVVRNELFLFLYHYLRKVQIRDVKPPRQGISLQWIGFERDRDYDAESEGRFAHIHYLRDYFDNPQRYYYFKIQGLGDPHVVKQLEGRQIVNIDFVFDRALGSFKPEAEQLALNTCIAQNRFEASLESFTVDETSFEYELTPDSLRDDLEVHNILEVTAIRDRERVTLRPYYRFQSIDINRDQQWFYALRQEAVEDDAEGRHTNWRTFIRFIDANHLGPGALSGWTISIRALCSNGRFGGKLGEGQLSRIGAGLKDVITPRNPKRPSRAIRPNISGNADWQFLAHLALDFSEFRTTDALRTMLGLYILDQRDTVSLRKLEGITPIVTERDYVVRRGSAIPGEKLVLSVDPICFKNSLGDIALFTQVLGRFLKAYASINSFLRLEVREEASQSVFTYTAWGDQ